MGYLPCVLITGWIANKKKENKKSLQTIGAMMLGTLACYFFGTVWFVAVMDGNYSIVQALLVCVVPYLILDTIKIAAAVAVVLPMKKMLRRIEQR